MSITPTKLEIARDLLKDSIIEKDEKIESLIHKAQERINYKTIKSKINLPSTANSAVDGYGILHRTFLNNPKTKFEVVGVSRAGHPFNKKILPHQAIDIYTGAILPEGVDTIIMHEKCKRFDDNVIVNEKEKQTRLIDNEIQKLIRLAIAESNKNNNSTNFALTPEGRLISTNFQANKGRLPWPLKQGVVVRRFGTQPHPVVRTTTINSNGISLATSPNSVAYSVFDGEILSVYGFSGGNPGVLIRHGKYISNYQNLSSIFVKKGDKIKANDEIGLVFTNESTGKTVLKFNIFNELKPENPTIWLDKY